MTKEAPIALSVSGISKTYHFAKKSEVFVALDDVSFQLHQGDVMGIIGRNGSGKSTLLKILSQITKPTSGSAQFYGSVTSILDIGTNFHPDLTGRENVELQLQLRQFPRSTYNELQTKIKEFSEIEDFFDQPVKSYSSGMFLRLAFSLAFHLSSDILILDEVLSVGNEAFRLKCFELLKSFTALGKTILFVSHNRMEILELSNTCLWLEKGKIKRIGNPASVLGEYFALQRDNFDEKKLVVDVQHSHSIQDSDNHTIDVSWDEANAPGNEVLSIRKLSVQPIDGGSKLYPDQAIEIKFLIHKAKKGFKVGAFFFIQDVFYQPVLVAHSLSNSGNEDFNSQLFDETGLIEIKCTLPPNWLIPGKYYLLPRFGVEENDWNASSPEAFRFSEKLSFTIFPQPEYIDYVGDITKGSVRPPLEWAVSKP